MTPRERIITSVVAMADMYGRTLQDATLAMWVKILSPYPPDQVERAVSQVITSRKYSNMPTPAEVLEHLNGGNAEDRGLIEAQKVLNAVSTVGGYKSVVFDDPVTQAVVKHTFGGWARLCDESCEDNRVWFEKEFVNAYRVYSQAGKREGGVCAGRFALLSAENPSGYTEKPVLIGDPEKAKAVLALPSGRLQQQALGDGVVSMKQLIEGGR